MLINSLIVRLQEVWTMFIFKRKPMLTEYDLDELKDIVGRTVEALLVSREETIHFIQQYDLILIFEWEKNYIEGSIYQYSTFEMAEGCLSSLRNIPLYAEKRYFSKDDNAVVYIDDEKIKGLSDRNLLAFYSLCELINVFKIDCHSSKRYECTW